MSDGSKTLFLHVGCRKSGTSALQHALRTARHDLRAEGVEQPLIGRGQVLRGLDADLVRAEPVVRRLATWVRDSPHPRHVISLEALAEWPPEAASLLVSALAEFDTRLVVTARPWAMTIPSEWQQRVKARYTGTYDEFVGAVLAPEPPAGAMAAEVAGFRRRQDLGDVVRRWRTGAPELPVHVILVPGDPHAQPGLFDLFCGVTGIEPGLLTPSERGRNLSLSHEDAEALRLVNIALGDRLADPRGDYRRSVRQQIAVDTMTGRSTGTRIRLPASWEDRASAEAARQLDVLRATGCEVSGDPEGFVHPDLPGEDFVPATDAAIAEAAAAALADLAVRQAERGGQPRRRRGQPGHRPGAPTPPPRAPHAAAAARRVWRVLRRPLRTRP